MSVCVDAPGVHSFDRPDPVFGYERQLSLFPVLLGTGLDQDPGPFRKTSRPSGRYGKEGKQDGVESPVLEFSLFFYLRPPL